MSATGILFLTMNKQEQTPPLPPGTSPLMAQYLTIKAANPDCLLFYRMGDFYELFFDDAGTEARAWDIALTKRGEHEGQPSTMCGGIGREACGERVGQEVE